MWLFVGNSRPSQSYGASLAIWDHTVLPSTRHKWTRPALTSASKLVLDLFTRRDGRLSWPGYPATHRGRGSNPRPLDHKSVALTSIHHRDTMVRQFLFPQRSLFGKGRLSAEPKPPISTRWKSMSMPVRGALMYSCIQFRSGLDTCLVVSHNWDCVLMWPVTRRSKSADVIALTGGASWNSASGPTPETIVVGRSVVQIAQTCQLWCWDLYLLLAVSIRPPTGVVSALAGLCKEFY